MKLMFYYWPLYKKYGMLCVLWDACNSQKNIFVLTRKKLALCLWHTWLAIYPNGRGETGKEKEKKMWKQCALLKEPTY